MDHEWLRDWLFHVDELTAAQRKAVAATLSERAEGVDTLAAIEPGVGGERRCPHCGVGGAASRGKARGLQKDLRRAHGHGVVEAEPRGALAVPRRFACRGRDDQGCTVRCGIAPNTAHRWRHRFPTTVRQTPERLAGIVEADGAFVPESRDAQRKLDRKPRRRGGKARKRGLSCEQVPVPVTARNHGVILGQTLTGFNADSVKAVPGPVLAPDTLRVSGANRCCPPVAAALNIPHASINTSGGERVWNTMHVQTVNSRRGQIEDFLLKRRGIATKYLDSHLRWFHLIERADQPSPGPCCQPCQTRGANYHSGAISGFLMISLRSLHASDIHLASPLTGLAGMEGMAEDRVRSAPRTAFDALVPPEEGVGGGIRCRSISTVSAATLACGEPARKTHLFDQPVVDRSRARVTGPFTVEAVPAPVAKPIEAEIDASLFEAYRGTESLPFDTGNRGRAGVTIVNNRVVESSTIVELE